LDEVVENVIDMAGDMNNVSDRLLDDF